MSWNVQPIGLVKNMYKGQTVHIIASGPSINDLDKSNFHGENCLFVNGSTAFYEQGMHAIGHVVSDKRFFIQKGNAAADFLLDGVDAFYADTCVEVLDDALKAHINRAFLIQKIGRSWKDKVLGNKVPAINEIDLEKGFYEAGTVAFVAAQLAMYMGYSTVVLHGVDLVDTTKPRFYEKTGEVAPSFLHGAVHNRILPAFKELYIFSQSKSAVIKNASPASQNILSFLPFFEFNKF